MRIPRMQCTRDSSPCQLTRPPETARRATINSRPLPHSHPYPLVPHPLGSSRALTITRYKFRPYAYDKSRNGTWSHEIIDNSDNRIYRLQSAKWLLDHSRTLRYVSRVTMIRDTVRRSLSASLVDCRSTWWTIPHTAVIINVAYCRSTLDTQCTARTADQVALYVYYETDTTSPYT